MTSLPGHRVLGCNFEEILNKTIAQLNLGSLRFGTNPAKTVTEKAHHLRGYSPGAALQLLT
jgi:hypothetical protein